MLKALLAKTTAKCRLLCHDKTKLDSEQPWSPFDGLLTVDNAVGRQSHQS